MIASSFARRAALAALTTLCAFPTAAVAADDAPTGGVAPDATVPTVPAPTPDAPSTPAPKAPGISAELPGAGTWSVASASTAAGQPVRIAGRFRADLAGRAVRVERRTPADRWVRAAVARVAADGRFSASWRTRSARYHDLRVVLSDGDDAAPVPPGTAGPHATADASDTVRVAVTDRARATWYGPGFYGRRTACGVTLRADTVGVAHRTLPCGTQVEVRMGDRSAVVPVIDRGPFANGADLDLTKNVADDLGLDGVGSVRYFERDDLAPLATPQRAPAL